MAQYSHTPPPPPWKSQEGTSWPDDMTVGDKPGAVCSRLCDQDEWPDFSRMCYRDFGVPSVEPETNTSSSSSSLLKKREPDISKGAKGDGHSSNAAEQKGKQEKPRTGKRKKDDVASPKGSTSDVTDQRTDYIHVRARRGQATDSHSLAERVRRERISERMRYLQGLVPGCNKVTGKAGMLDEIINYVQSLQNQVEFLSMRLAAANPVRNFNVEGPFSSQINQTCKPALPPGMTLPIGHLDPSLLQCSSMQAAGSSSFELDMVLNSISMCPSISAPTPMDDASLDSCLNVNGSAWDIGLQELLNAGFPQGNGFDLPFQ